MPRSLEQLLADLDDALDAAAELVGAGEERWRAERLLRLAGEAIVGRIGDIAAKLPDDFTNAVPGVPWRQIKAMRIVVDHVYHRIDYDVVWATLTDDLPALRDALTQWSEDRGRS